MYVSGKSEFGVVNEESLLGDLKFSELLAQFLGNCPFLGTSKKMETAVGMAMVPRGEVGLIFAELGRSSGLLDATAYAGIVLVIAYTTLFSPFWIKLFYRIYGDHPALKSQPLPDR